MLGRSDDVPFDEAKASTAVGGAYGAEGDSDDVLCSSELLNDGVSDMKDAKLV